MKQPKKPNRNQKILLSRSRLNTDNWMVQEDDKTKIVFVHKITHESRIYEKVV